MNLVPRIIPGALNNANKDAIDWNHHGLLVYGCQSTVVVLDPRSFRVLQCMEKYHEPITKVKWCPDHSYHNIDDPYSLKLASADTSGNILIWDVYKSSVQSEFRDGNKTIADMIWYSSDNNSQLLLVIHSPNIVTLWNTQTGTKIWRIVYDHDRQRDTEIFLQIIQDPFNHQRAILLSQSNLTFIEDFSPINTPSGQSRRFYISNTNKQQNIPSHLLKRSASVTSTSSLLTARLKNIIEGNDHAKQDEQLASTVVSLNDCIQILFHPIYRHLILIVYPREILIFDLQILQTVGTILCEKNSAAFYKIYACYRRDTFICFHENGTISVRNRYLENSTIAALQSPNHSLSDFVIDFTYDLVYYSDPFRLIKNTRICSFFVSPKDETMISVILTDGKVLFWNIDQKVVSIPSMIETHNEGNNGNRIPLGGVMFAPPPSPYVIHMCPPMTAKNWKEWKSLLAIGCTNGDIVIFYLDNGTIQRQLAVHSCGVRGLVWLSSEIILSWAYQIPGDGRYSVRNELFIVHIQSGRQEAFRSEINHEESPIESLKVSHTKNYLIILFRDQPFELWDLKSFTLIRRLPKKCPKILALDWSPNASATKKNSEEITASVTGRLSSTSTESDQEVNKTANESETNLIEQEKKLPRENFIFTDEYNLLYHFYVEGRTIKEVATVPPDHSSAAATDLVLKGDYLLSGDVDGIIQIFNIKLKQSKSFNTKRSPIRKVRFAPGKGNFRAFILFNDGVDIWDIRDRDRISTLKYPRDTIQINDGDWASSDKIVLACSDHCLRIYEMNLTDCSSSLEFQTIQQSTLYPYLIPARHANLFKHLLCVTNGSIDDLVKKCEDGNLSPLLEKELSKLDHESKNYLANTKSTIDRCLFVANLFNDPWEQRFWRLTEYYLYQYSSSDENSSRPSPLLPSYDLLLDCQTFEQIQLERTIRRDIKCSSSTASLLFCIDSYIALKQIDRAVQLLLDTDPNDDTYALNCIKACLISSMQKQSIETSKNTVTKLVATNLIANGKVDEGVQLLCTIDLCSEACRYLQDHNQWERSVWLAKLRLKSNSNEYLDVIKRWSEHVRLNSSTLKMNSALILISSGQFRRAIEILHSQGATELAIRLFACCKQFGIDDGTIGQKLFDDYIDLMQSFGFTSIANDYRTTVVV